VGIYINPTEGTKELWLLNHRVLTKADYKTTFPVVLVDNGAFTAAAVCDTPDEYTRFMVPDGRTKYVFSVPIEALRKVLDPREMEILDATQTT